MNYASPAAFRRALTDRLRALAVPRGRWPLPSLQRQFAFDRLLTRLYLSSDGWVVKGAAALLARRIAVRHTLDVDVYLAASRREAEHTWDPPGAASLADAVHQVGRFLDPLLAGEAEGTWQPEERRWACERLGW